MKEMTIDLKDLIYRILLQWRKLLIAMLIFCVLLTVVGGYKSFSANKTAQAKLDAQIAAGGPKEGEKEVVVPPVVWVDPADMVLGAMVGAVLICGVVFVKYLMADKLRVKGDMKDGFGLTLLGSVRRSKAKDHKVDKLIDGLFHPRRSNFKEQQQILMMVTDIKLAAQKAGMQKVYLTGACNDGVTEELKKLFLEKLQEDLPEISAGRSAVVTPESLETLVDADGVVLFERVDASLYSDIAKELEFCERYQVPVIGAIVVE